MKRKRVDRTHKGILFDQTRDGSTHRIFSNVWNEAIFGRQRGCGGSVIVGGGFLYAVDMKKKTAEH